MTSVATFNANNFFLRYKFGQKYPGDMSGVSEIPAAEAERLGYLPGKVFGNYADRYIVWDPERRNLSARALAGVNGQLPDILCFQEVENIHTLRLFNQRHLADHYANILLIDSHDNRGIDVGIMSIFPMADVRTHIDDSGAPGGGRLFSRDCLEVDVELPANETVTLYINHFKSRFTRRQPGESDAAMEQRRLEDHQLRLAQAAEVATLVGQHFPASDTQSLYAVVGDFNDTPESPWVQPLVTLAQLTNLVRQHRGPTDQWTYYYRSRNRVSQIDYVLASPALAARVAATVAGNPDRRPHIERQGLGWNKLNAAGDDTLPQKANLIHFEPDAVTPAPPVVTPSSKVDFRFPRYPEVRADRLVNISDHCPVKVWF